MSKLHALFIRSITGRQQMREFGRNQWSVLWESIGYMEFTIKNVFIFYYHLWIAYYTYFKLVKFIINYVQIYMQHVYYICSQYILLPSESWLVNCHQHTIGSWGHHLTDRKMEVCIKCHCLWHWIQTALGPE